MALFRATSNGALLVFILPSVSRAKAALPLLFFFFFFVFLLSAPIPTIASCPSTLPVAVSACRSLSLEAAFCDRSLPYAERTHDLISRLSLQEKAWQMVNMANGVERLGIPGYQWWQEALHGVANSPGVCFDHERGVPGATSFPQVILTGATFNPKLWRAIGEVVSTEARAMYNLGLAGLTYWSPNVNIFRDPRWGRGQETPGEDPLLTSKYAVNYVRGLQDVKGDSSGRLKIAACCKHYTSYDVDNWMGRDFRVAERFLFDAKVTQQDLEDTYQPPFEKCIRDGNVACVMCSYNKVNGVPMCLNRMLLRDIIRERWGLKGYICSDCDSVQVATEFMRYKTSPQAATAQSILAGLNVNCGNTLANYTEVAVKSYLLNETTVDESLTHVFTTLMRLGFFDGDVSDQPFGKLGANDICTPQHRKLALDAARQGIVLLKNSHNSLPLSTNHVKTLLVVGPNANATTVMIGNYAGTPCGFTTALEGLVKFTDVVFKEGCVGTFCEGRPDLIRNASAAAANVDATVIVVGLDQGQEREGYDRLDLLLPGLQEKLVMDVAQASKGPVILVVMSGGPVDIAFAKNNPKISSILWVGYPGGDGGQAIAEIIFGKYNPAGRLPMTWYPQSYIETLSMADMSMRPRLLKKQVISLGRTYRFYLGTPVFKFGEGLSYTNFNYSLPSQVGTLMVPMKSLPCTTSSSGSTKMGDLACTAVRINKLDCSEMTFNLSVKVGNDGNMDGHHVVLIYAHPQASHKGAPIKQLVAFDRVLVRQGKSKEVKLHINACEHLTTVDEYGHKVLALGAHKLTIGDNPNHYNTLLHVNPM